MACQVPMGYYYCVKILIVDIIGGIENPKTEENRNKNLLKILNG